MAASLLTDLALVAFLVLNILQISVVLSILVYAVGDVFRKCNPEEWPRPPASMLAGGRVPPMAFVGGRVSVRAMDRFEGMLTPTAVGLFFLDDGSSNHRRSGGGVALPASAGPDAYLGDRRTKKRDDDRDLLGILKAGHEGFSRPGALAQGGVTADAQTAVRFATGLMPVGEETGLIAGTDADARFFEMMGRDPLVFFSAAVAKYAENYSPFKARRFMTRAQVSNNLVYPHHMTSGSAFVLPSGYVVNKAWGMDEEDLQAWNALLRVADGATADCSSASCTSTPPVRRIRVFGLAGSETNREAKEEGEVETLLCGCRLHGRLLQDPDPAIYSSIPKVSMQVPRAGHTAAATQEGHGGGLPARGFLRKRKDLEG
uniref:Wsv325-like protein n=1 Tax=Sicyonia whispovirus TaxID=2984283 RepID=A0A9C7C707_9VIRU|nr:MAG: wsv325-like protein [Sicyonia whispovirus]